MRLFHFLAFIILTQLFIRMLDTTTCVFVECYCGISNYMYTYSISKSMRISKLRYPARFRHPGNLFDRTTTTVVFVTQQQHRIRCISLYQTKETDTNHHNNNAEITQQQQKKEGDDDDDDDIVSSVASIQSNVTTTSTANTSATVVESNVLLLRSTPEQNNTVQAKILQPFSLAANPNYKNNGIVGINEFVIERMGGPRKEELTNENILRIVKSQCTDLEVNTLVWKCLGYRFGKKKENDDDDDEVQYDNNKNSTNTTTTTTSNSTSNTNFTWYASKECFPKWKEQYPLEPPDLIGMQRIYTREIDQISLRSNQALVRSIPMQYKQSLKQQLKPYGWKGYQYKELTPNLTRRAQCANWLLYYREELFGSTIQELQQQRRKQQQQLKEANPQPRDGEKEEWQPPVREVF